MKIMIKYDSTTEFTWIQNSKGTFVSHFKCAILSKIIGGMLRNVHVCMKSRLAIPSLTMVLQTVPTCMDRRYSSWCWNARAAKKKHTAHLPVSEKRGTGDEASTGRHIIVVVNYAGSDISKPCPYKDGIEVALQGFAESEP